jgi:hypothetical protein
MQEVDVGEVVEGETSVIAAVEEWKFLLFKYLY